MRSKSRSNPESRYNPHPPNIKYLSPDGIRPNKELIEKTRENFNKKFPPIKGPSPSNLPMPSDALLKKKIQGKKRTWTIKSTTQPYSQKIQGKNRSWTIKRTSKNSRKTAGKRMRKQ